MNYGFDPEDAGKIMGLAAYGKQEAFYIQQKWEQRAFELAKMFPNRNLVLAGNFNMTNVDELFNDLIDLGQHPKEKADTVTILEKILYREKVLDRQQQLQL